MDIVPTRLEQMAWFPDLSGQGDFFMHIKSIFLILTAVWMLAVLIDHAVLQRKTVFLLKRDFPLFIFAFFVVVSSCFSTDPGISMYGLSEQYETCPVLLAYLVVFWYTAMIVREGIHVRVIAGAAMAGAAIQGAIGISQASGHDFWGSTPGKWLILLGNDAKQELQFQFTEEAGGKIYLSFYNPNYAAVYLLFLIPVTAAAIFLFRKVWQKIFAAVLTAVLLFCLWATGSRTAFLVLPVLLAACGILYCAARRKKAAVLGFCGICAAAVVCGTVFLASGSLSADSIIKNIFPAQRTYYMQDIVLKEDLVEVTYRDTVLCLQMQEENGAYWFSVADENGVTYPMDQDPETGKFTLKNDLYAQLEFDAYRQDGASHIVMYKDMYTEKIPWHFVRQPEWESYQYVTLYGKTDRPEHAEAVFAKGYERAFTDRMYLWQRSIPLLRNSLILGTGPCTFPLVFPQNDYVMRANLGIKMLMEIISRPHSFYLQTAIQTGVLSLAALLWFFFRYIKKALSVLRTETARTVLIWNGAVILAVLSYMLTGLTNDSVVVTAPIFWAMLGAGYGLMERYTIETKREIGRM